jgi:iron complex outermembrane receptor protein
MRFSEALFASLVYHPHKKLGLQLLLREDFIDDSFSPIQWSFGASWQALKWLELKGNFSRNYRAPGLNDLYWQPGGNPDLQTETGLSYEVGLAFAKNSKHHSLSAEITWFDSWINDMIIWVPGSGNVWSPQNKRQVRASGTETLVSYNRTINKWKFGFSARHNWTRSIVQQSYSTTDAAIGNQLLNTPIQEAGLQLNLSWRFLSFSYGQTYMGRRPITSDNVDWLEAYTLGWIQVGAMLPVKRNSLGITAKFHNLWNTEYQYIKWRPMPGFNYSLTIKYQFK